MSLKTGRRINVGKKIVGKQLIRPNTAAGVVRVNNFSPSASRRRVPKGIRRAPIESPDGRVPPGYTSFDKMSMTVPLSVREHVLPTILPVGRKPAPHIDSHDVPVREDWSKLFSKSKIVCKTQDDLKRKQKQVARMLCTPGRAYDLLWLRARALCPCACEDIYDIYIIYT